MGEGKRLHHHVGTDAIVKQYSQIDKISALHQRTVSSATSFLHPRLATLRFPCASSICIPYTKLKELRGFANPKNPEKISIDQKFLY
jgi:hypothetical protein